MAGMHTMIAAGVVSASLAGAAHGQGFNIDYGLAFSAPSDSYGAASGQTGFWNDLGGSNTAPIALADLNGNATNVTIQNVNGNAAFSFNNALTSGDDEALMDDLLDLGAAVQTDTFIIAGLAAGEYDVYTYAWAPDSSTFLTGVSVNGSTQTLVGGAWSGFAEFITHALDTVTLAGGEDLVFTMEALAGFGSLDGIQVVPLGVACIADCNEDDELDVFDFVCFQTAFQSGDFAKADCNGDGELDVFDFVCFQTAFQAGCP